MRRRDLGAAALLLGTSPQLFAGTSPAPEAEEFVDILVAGSGAAGLSAALSAVEAGARKVLLIEKFPLAGGHTILSSGSVAAEYSPEGISGLMNEILAFGEGHADPELARTLAEGSGAAKDRLERLGVRWISAPFRAVGAPSARSWNTGSPQSGYDYVQVLMRGLRKTTAEVRFRTRAESLLLADNGAIAGVYVFGPDGRRSLIRTRAFVIATGGYTASKRLLKRFAPEIPPGLETTASSRGELLDGATGDGILLAEAAGAKLLDMDAIQMLPLAGGRLLDYVGAEVWLNDEGRRFVSEGSGFREIEKAMTREGAGAMWVISDARSPKGATLGLKLMDGTVREAATLEEAARGMNVDPAVLSETLERYNRSVRKNWDDDFGIPLRGSTVETPPFFYGREHFALHYACGGVAIDKEARVLRPDGRPIPGLFAAGEVTGGVHGRMRVGACGLTDAFVFGDIAGRSAAESAAAG